MASPSTSWYRPQSLPFEVLELLKLLGVQHLAAVVHVRVVPSERFGHPVVHADIEIGHDDDRGLQALGKVEGLRPHREAFAGIGGEQQYLLGVAVRGIGAGNDVGLLRARRHAGGRAAALDIEQYHRHFGKIGKAQEFAHQGDAGARCGGEGRAPFQPPPMATPMAANSSSACTMP